MTQSAKDLHGKEVIRFYRRGDAYGCFSNFSAHAVEIGGKLYATSEHYFQAQKFVDTEHEEVVRLANTPSVAAKIGRDRGLPRRSDWENVKDDIMREVVLAKFRQHADIRELLLSTGDAYLIESTKNDSYWADGGDGTGKNMLGIILMEVRAILRKEAPRQ